MKFLPWLFPCRTCTTLVTLMSSKVSQMCFWRIWSPYPHSDHCEQTWYCLMWPLETISKITALWKPALLRASTCWGVIMNNTAFQNSIPPFALIHSLKLLLGSQPFQIMATTTFLFCHTVLVFFSLLCSQKILQLVCNGYLISSSFPIKEFHLFSLSGRLRRELITVYRHLHSLSVWSILTLQTESQEALAPGNKSHRAQWVLPYNIANAIGICIIQPQHTTEPLTMWVLSQL